MQLQINGKLVQVDANPATPLLWLLRDVLDMTGTKYGCGVAACGACTVRVDGQAVRSCVTPRRACRAGRSRPSKALERPAAASRPDSVAPSRSAMRLLPARHADGGDGVAGEKTKPTDTDIDAAISNLCRCGTYQRVRVAIHRPAGARMPTAVPAPVKQAHPHTAARALGGRTRAGIHQLASSQKSVP